MGVVWDEGGQRALVIDDGLNALLEIDMKSGTRTVLSGAGIGSGPDLGSPIGVAWDARGQRALVVDDALDVLMGIDVESGVRTVLSGGSTGAGPNLDSPTCVAWNVRGQRALVVKANVNSETALIGIDVESGARTVLSSYSNGAGAHLDYPVGVAWDERGQRALVVDPDVDFDEDELIGIDVVSGTRTVLAHDDVGPGPTLDSPTGVAWDESGQRALVIDEGLSALIGIDVASGARTVLSNYSTGSGPGLVYPISVAWDADAQRALVVDVDQSVLIAIDVVTGERVIVSD